MIHNIVLSYDYVKLKRWRQWTNVPLSLAILIASMYRAFLEATECCHQETSTRVTTTTRQCKMYPLCWPFWWPALCVSQWRRFMAFIKATKCPYQASTHSDSINRTHQCRLFLQFHREKGLKLTCWPLITITHQTDEKHLRKMSEYFVEVVNKVFNRYNNCFLWIVINQ